MFKTKKNKGKGKARGKGKSKATVDKEDGFQFLGNVPVDDVGNILPGAGFVGDLGDQAINIEFDEGCRGIVEHEVNTQPPILPPVVEENQPAEPDVIPTEAEVTPQILSEAGPKSDSTFCPRAYHVGAIANGPHNHSYPAKNDIVAKT
ncbi:hypothetical protein Salat_1692200 [Sesamum alatum]|uniref:Uncharacterized protein n=1 Tax=Sesamum alatum TaxID=300844 RepID=A0AAE2CK03_9LAMI|nr:hypothetical protein Salat_1692200 [Sesamum alatum]